MHFCESDGVDAIRRQRMDRDNDYVFLFLVMAAVFLLVVFQGCAKLNDHPRKPAPQAVVDADAGEDVRD